MWGMKHLMQSGHNDSRPAPTDLALDQQERSAELKARQAAINREIVELQGKSPQVRIEGDMSYRPDGNAGEPRA